MSLRVTVLDANAEGASAVVETSADAPLDELRGLILSLGSVLPAAAAADGGARLLLCHDGRVLTDDDKTLAELGVAEAPAVVALASFNHLVNADPAAAAMAGASAAQLIRRLSSYSRSARPPACQRRPQKLRNEEAEVS